MEPNCDYNMGDQHEGKDGNGPYYENKSIRNLLTQKGERDSTGLIGNYNCFSYTIGESFPKIYKL